MIHLTSCKSYLTKRQGLDTWFVSKYKLAPYAGCAHQCTYCDGRSEKYYFEGDFNKDVYVRYDIADRVREELGKNHEKGPILLGSGYTDVYQPTEKKFKLTRQLLSTLYSYHHKYAVVILTKSDLVLRDLDLLQALQKHQKIMVLFSLTTHDDTLTSWLEPGASSATARLKAIKTLTQHKIPVGVMAMPMVPYLNDRNQGLLDFFKHLKHAGVSYVIPGTMTLRPGDNKDHFIKALQGHQPDLVETIMDLYDDNKASGMPKSHYDAQFNQHVYGALKHVGIQTRAPHHIYKNWFNNYDAISMLLDHMTTLYHDDSQASQRLASHLTDYKSWLSSTQEAIGMKQTRFALLDQALDHLVTNPFDLDRPLDDRLISFIKHHLDGHTFNYTTKKWQEK